jgi:broad specificity phosphatase PhoE
MSRSQATSRIALLLAFVLSLAAQAAAQTTVFLIRHAERADTTPGAAPTMAADPNLSAAGRARASSLASALKDAKITAIYATEFKRTQQTAAPLAKALGLTVTTMPSKKVTELIARVNAEPGNVLVVGHSNTVPEVIKGLGIEAEVKIDDSEYDNLFVLTRGDKPTLVRLHYK